MARSFSAVVSAKVAARKDLMRAVFKSSVQDIAAIAQTPGPSKANPGGGRGGHLPIDTGFLRASFTATLTPALPAAMPRPNGEANYSYDATAVNLVIAGADLGDTITLAYTANYARFVHRSYQWVTLAAQQWPQVVARNAAEAERRFRL